MLVERGVCVHVWGEAADLFNSNLPTICVFLHANERLLLMPRERQDIIALTVQTSRPVG